MQIFENLKKSEEKKQRGKYAITKFPKRNSKI